MENLDQEKEQRLRDRLMSVDWIPIKWNEDKISCSGAIRGYHLLDGPYSRPVVLKSDVDILVENSFREIARKLKVRYEEVEPILREENSVFFKQAESVFSEWKYFYSHSSNLRKLIGLLRIPDVSQIPPEKETEKGVSGALKAIAGLNADEKKELISLSRELIGESEVSA